MLFKGSSTAICEDIAELIRILGKEATIQDAMKYLNGKQVA